MVPDWPYLRDVDTGFLQGGGDVMRLSAREETILRLVAAGRSDKQMARELEISVHTIRTHFDRIYKRNGLHNRAEAVAAWLRASSDPPKPVG